MMRQVLSQTDIIAIPLVAAVLFVTLFVGMLLWVYRRGASETYSKRSLMVFDEGLLTASMQDKENNRGQA